MKVLALYVRTEQEGSFYRERFCQHGIEPAVHVMPDATFYLPALRTEKNLYQGMRSVERVLALVLQSPKEQVLGIEAEKAKMKVPPEDD